jgi:hypothetical protein
VVFDVALQDFSHECVDRPATGRQKLESVGTFFLIVGQGAFYGLYLPSDPLHPIEQLRTFLTSFFHGEFLFVRHIPYPSMI